MNIAAAADQIETVIYQMGKSVGETVFNEWAILSKQEKGWRLMDYSGPRKEEFLASFNTDMASLRKILDPDNLHTGDYAFTHEGHGSGFDAYMCIGEGIVLILNNLQKNTTEIAENPQWKSAQIHFANLLEQFLTDPIQV